ncbi:hypothetical protein [Amycolatopsis aidingensis]|uniref:hypothetical protein n=1 Tax=Amycolatopsis aidingensis TaxID=2842453 RepID=UPI001C0CD637|nr:hypothetical protein [Amycolatopsis aidingensis]
MPDWIWWIVAPLVLGGWLYYQWQQKKARRDAYRELAHRLGWQYVDNDRGLAKKYSGRPFDDAEWRSAKHVFRGQYRGRGLTAFEFGFRLEETDRHGDERTETVLYQVIAVKLAGERPWLEVGERGFFGGLLRKAGVHVKDTGDPAFDEVFAVSTDDPAFAEDVLAEDVRAWLRGDGRAQDNPIRVHGDEIITWRRGPLEPADLQPRVDFLNDFLDRVPDGALV